jgi:hypothetical protein
LVVQNGEERIRTSGYIAASSDFKSDAIDQLCHLSRQSISLKKDMLNLYYPN